MLINVSHTALVDLDHLILVMIALDDSLLLLSQATWGYA